MQKEDDQHTLIACSLVIFLVVFLLLLFLLTLDFERLKRSNLFRKEDHSQLILLQSKFLLIL